jgi:hypothetical protein
VLDPNRVPHGINAKSLKTKVRKAAEAMKISKVLFATTLVILSTQSKADLWSQYQTPNAIKCEVLRSNIKHCTDSTRPEKHVVQYQDQSGQTTMREEPTIEVVTCIPQLGKCIDNSRNYRGKSKTEKDLKYVVYLDFYISPGADGTDWAYKNGTGPLFGGAIAGNNAIKPMTTSVKATATANGTYDIWCDPQSDSCDLTIDGGSDQVSRARLPVYVPMATIVDNCSMEFCYNSNQDVIGLNPEYALWKK